MNETRNIKVVKTDGSVIQVRLNSFDIARSLALVGSLTEPVILIHQGHCLYPFMSIASQNVSDGDVVVLKPVKSASNPKSKLNEICGKSILSNRFNRQPYRQPKKPPANTDELDNQPLNNNMNFDYKVFEEVLRISDLQFKAYESSISGGFAYQQMAEMLNFTPPSDQNTELNGQVSKSDENSKSEKLKTVSNPNEVPLPVFWSTTDEEFNNQSQTHMKKIPDLPDRPQVVPSSSVD